MFVAATEYKPVVASIVLKLAGAGPVAVTAHPEAEKPQLGVYFTASWYERVAAELKVYVWAARLP